jgi:flagellar biosynthesis/type III secretory pathway protein FliH
LQADVSNIDASTDKRLEVVEQRLMEIEKKPLMRPPDAA